ncbi:hypothetical protein GCM10027586_07820 [Kineococcus gypseus]|uniref:hypothetical protein n=1 Tax=Kineococcus gypseus TaxID=1637102 RepID=UPI003D7EC4F2
MNHKPTAAHDVTPQHQDQRRQATPTAPTSQLGTAPGGPFQRAGSAGALDPAFREALRAELVRTVEHAAPASTTAGTRASTRAQLAPAAAAQQAPSGWQVLPGSLGRWRRRSTAAGCVLLAALAGGGVAVATGALPLPGAKQVSVLSAPSTVVRTGSATIELGPRPATATSVELSITCLSAGTFTFADGASLACTPGDVESTGQGTGQDASTGTATYSLPLAEGQNSTTITTSAKARWSLSTAYSLRQDTAWAINARGQSYGVLNEHGVPDLVAVTATNGRVGYAYASELGLTAPPASSPQEALEQQALQQARPASLVPVYDSEGTTLIGQFQRQ